MALPEAPRRLLRLLPPIAVGLVVACILLWIYFDVASAKIGQRLEQAGEKE